METSAWLVVDSFISAAKVIKLCDLLKLLTHKIQVFLGARVITILCTSMKTLRECLVQVIFS